MEHNNEDAVNVTPAQIIKIQNSMSYFMTFKEKKDKALVLATVWINSLETQG